jgi:hypothetical protein
MVSTNLHAQDETIIDADGNIHRGGLAPLPDDWEAIAREQGLFAEPEDLLFDVELPEVYTPIGSLFGFIPAISQGAFGTCYAFAGAYTVFLAEAKNRSRLQGGYENYKEGMDWYMRNMMIAPNTGIKACSQYGNGGWWDPLFDHYIRRGLALLSNVPYVGRGYSRCDFLDPNLRGDSWRIIGARASVSEIKRAVIRFGAVAIGIQSNCLSKSSTVRECPTRNYNHAVVIYGWTRTHFLIQNSWDASRNTVVYYLHKNSSPFKASYVVPKNHVERVVPRPNPTPRPNNNQWWMFLILGLAVIAGSITLGIFRKKKGN